MMQVASVGTAEGQSEGGVIHMVERGQSVQAGIYYPWHFSPQISMCAMTRNSEP
jgi:hypothetical protein